MGTLPPGLSHWGLPGQVDLPPTADSSTRTGQGPKFTILTSQDTASFKCVATIPNRRILEVWASWTQFKKILFGVRGKSDKEENQSRWKETGGVGGGRLCGPA